MQTLTELKRPPTKLCVFNNKLICATKRGKLLEVSKEIKHIYSSKSDIISVHIIGDSMYLGSVDGSLICMNTNYEVLFISNVATLLVKRILDLNENLLLGVDGPKIVELNKNGEYKRAHYVCGSKVIDFLLHEDKIFIISENNLRVDVYNLNFNKIMTIKLPNVGIKMVIFNNNIIILHTFSISIINSENKVRRLEIPDKCNCCVAIADALYIGTTNGKIYRFNCNMEFDLIFTQNGIINDIVLYNNNIIVALSQEPIVGKYGKNTETDNVLISISL